MHNGRLEQNKFKIIGKQPFVPSKATSKFY